MIKDRKALIRVAAALIFIFIFTATTHELRRTSSPADFACPPIFAVTESELSKGASIEIAAGATGSAIAAQLFEEGVVKSARAFFGVAVGDPRAGKIAPGTHIISKSLCAEQALDQLLDSKRIAGLINIGEGAWNSEIYASMRKAGFSKAEINSALSKVELPAGFKSLEGLLFPAQYSFAKGTSAFSALSSMRNRSVLEWKKAGFTNRSGKYDDQDLVTIASIIQAEGRDEDFTKVSRVIRNRLEIGMPLQMDSTVHYVMNQRGDIFLSTKSTLLKSPYNTYRNYGLPPGPICNPGAKALNAAVNPEPGDWLYFITVAPTDTRFTSSIDEFTKWKIEYKKNLRAGLFRSSK